MSCLTYLSSTLGKVVAVELKHRPPQAACARRQHQVRIEVALVTEQRQLDLDVLNHLTIGVMCSPPQATLLLLRWVDSWEDWYHRVRL